jgi:hypothetical protein
MCFTLRPEDRDLPRVKAASTVATEAFRTRLADRTTTIPAQADHRTEAVARTLPQPR